MSGEKSHTASGTHSSFRSFCELDAWDNNSTDRKDRSFVGIRIEKSDPEKPPSPRIYFPMGYRVDGDSKRLDAELKADFYRLVELLADKTLPSYLSSEDRAKCRLDFPMHAFIGVLQHYQDFGYFMETEVVYRKGYSGKISWSRTIKNIRPQAFRGVDGRCDIVYLDVLTRKVSHKEDNLITLIHKYCVYEAARLIGPIWGITENEVDFPEIEIDYDLFMDVLLEKIGESYNDRNLELFQNLALVVKFCAQKPIEGTKDEDFEFGVNTFAPVWEMMIDRVFGTVSRTERKLKYDPHLRFAAVDAAKPDGVTYQDGDDSADEKNRSTLRPDTIMRRKGSDGRMKVFILDSKYYKYGMKGYLSFLPGAESVCKQMAYAEFVETDKKYHSGINACDIYNAFIMPYSREFPKSGPALDLRQVDRDGGIAWAGQIFGDWKGAGGTDGENRPYHKIACILVDMKAILRNHAPSDELQKKLAALIEERTH